MKDIYIANIGDKKEISDFFMVKMIAVKMGSNKKQYLDILLSDMTGEITGKKWDLADEELEGLSHIEAGDIVKIKAQVTEWNGQKQLKITKIRKGQKEDLQDIKDYIKAAPEKPEEMYDYIFDKAEKINDSDLGKLCVKVLKDNKDKLMYYPAAQKNHHAEMAGLLWHMKRMLMTAEKVCQVYSGLDKDLVAAGVILHDTEKIREIEANEYGISDGYSFEGMMLGHIVQSIKVLDKEMKEMDFPSEKRIMVEHMVLSHHYEPEYGSPKKPLFPEAEMLHYLDMIDARMYDMEKAIEKTMPGEFSERVWTMENRRIYRRMEKEETEK